MNSMVHGISLMLLVATLQTSLSAVSKVLSGSVALSLSTLFYYLIPCIFFMPNLIKNGITDFTTKYHTLYFLRAISSIGSVACFFYTASILNLGITNLLFTTSPIFAALIARVCLNEKLSFIGMLGICISFWGIYYIIAPNTFEIPSKGIIFGLASGVLAAITQILLKYLVKLNEPTKRIVFYQYANCSIILIIFLGFNLIHQNNLINTIQFSVAKITFLILLIGVISFSGQYIMARAFKYLPAHQLIPILYVSIPLSVLADYIFWGNNVNFSFFKGAILVFFGIILNLYQWQLINRISYIISQLTVVKSDK